MKLRTGLLDNGDGRTGVQFLSKFAGCLTKLSVLSCESAQDFHEHHLARDHLRVADLSRFFLRFRMKRITRMNQCDPISSIREDTFHSLTFGAP